MGEGWEGETLIESPETLRWIWFIPLPHVLGTKYEQQQRPRNSQEFRIGASHGRPRPWPPPWAAFISLNRFLGPVDSCLNDYVTTNSPVTKSQFTAEEAEDIFEYLKQNPFEYHNPYLRCNKFKLVKSVEDKRHLHNMKIYNTIMVSHMEKRRVVLHIMILCVID